MMNAPVTAFYASLLAVCYVYLSALVIQARRKAKVGLGDGGDQLLQRMIRVHANFIEYVPMGILLLLMFELNSYMYWALHTGGVMLLFGRLLHAYGLRNSGGVSWQRFVGMLMTFGAIIFLAVMNLYVVYWLSLL